MGQQAYVHEFTVAGTGYFPTDMLRYDGCYPATSDDANRMDRPDIPGEPRAREVKLIHIGPKSWNPTNGRWESFTWKVVDVGMRKAGW